MPRKGFSNFNDYDDGFDDDEYDYDYDYDHDAEETAVTAESVKEITISGVWSCRICTYDNDENLFACDICGVLQNPSVQTYGDDKTTGSSSNILKEKQDGLNEQNLSKKSFQPRTSNSSSVSVPKGKQDMLEDKSYPKDGANDIALREEVPKEVADSLDDTSSIAYRTDGPQSLNSNSNKFSSTGGTGDFSAAKVVKQKIDKKYKPEQWMLPDKGPDTLSQLNLAIVGHVDSGKSTLSGRLLHLFGRISQKQMHKNEREAKLQGKSSFAYAWALDESAEERERGITMTVAVAYFDTKKHHVVVLDSPGHKDFVPNMITGATQADAGILVIDASVGAFEAGLDNAKGQTKEHARVLRGFGVEQIIVAVNKMDAVKYSKDRFDLIKQQLGSFLLSCRFKDSSITWVPLSAMENQNLVSAPSDSRLLSWHKGPCLVDAIDSLRSPTRDLSKPLLLPVCDVIKTVAQGQVSVCGKLEAGALRAGSKVLVVPSGDTATVRSLERDSQSCTVARAGDNVSVTLQGIDANCVMAGDVLCHPDFPVSVATHLELTVLVLEGAFPILIGSQLEFHIHHAKEAARVVKIVSLLDPKTGEPTKKSPRCLTAKQSAVLEVVLQAPVCVETFTENRAIGRVFLRSLGKTVAMGKVSRVIHEE